MEDPIDRSPGVSTGAASGSDDLVPEDHGEVETWMAFWLENVSPDDPQIHAILVERYGVEMCRLADYLLGNSTRRHAPAETLELASMGFDDAVASLATFRGAPSARSWLYAQLLRRSRDWRRYLRWPWAARGRASRRSLWSPGRCVSGGLRDHGGLALPPVARTGGTRGVA